MSVAIEPTQGPIAESRERLQRLADGIASFLDETLRRTGAFPARSFYGEAFSALLLGRRGDEFSPSVSRLRDLYLSKDHDDPAFHWEFNLYAWCTLNRHRPDAETLRLTVPLRFRGTPVTNWTLLRACTRFLAGRDVATARREACDVLKRFQLASGLICDQPNVRSFQYHCFSAVLAAELHTLSGDPFFLERFRRAAEFIEHFVLRTGDALYVGRGQQQTFGYGALAYLLATAYRHFGDSRFVSALSRCASFIEAHRRPDGSFPLVLNGLEEGFPAAAAHADPRFPGWYAYNNYFDYLAFLGVFLDKAVDQLRGAPEPGSVASRDGYRDRHFLVHHSSKYEAVVARPGGGWRGGDGYWTNDVPFPYLVAGGRRITPSYGGEQFGSPLYSPACVPLPTFERFGKRTPMRRGRIWSRLVGRRLIVLSPHGVLTRHFRFLDQGIVVDDRVIGLGRAYPRYLFEDVRALDDRTFLIRGGARLTFSVPMRLEVAPTEHFWGGRLHALITRDPAARCTVHLDLGGHP